MREREGSSGETGNRRNEISPTVCATSVVIWYICVLNVVYFSVKRMSVTIRGVLLHRYVHGVHLHTTNVPGRVRTTEEKRTKLRTVKDRKPRSYREGRQGNINEHNHNRQYLTK